MFASQEKWITSHPYLAELARFQRIIDATIGEQDTAVVPLNWENFKEEFSKGTPVLKARPLDTKIIAGAGVLLERLVAHLAETDSPVQVKHACAILRDEFGLAPEASAKVLERVAAGSENSVRHNAQIPAGLVRYLSWMALERVLRPWIANFSVWSDDASWGRPFCPVCGSLPSMAQLRRTDKGRERFLSCGCCGSRWNFQRTGCPFCGNDDQNTLEILEAEEEKDFRIDVCCSCSGYLKTYTREGNEALLLADWSTLHLDLVARKRGLQRHGNSLYEL